MKSDFLIVSFCSFDLVNIAMNWVAFLKDHKIENYLIVSMDQETFDFLIQQKVNTKFIAGKILKRSGTGWRFRFETMYELLKNQSILHCDLDAVWLKDARELLDDDNDIIVSMDTGGWPPLTYERIGFTMCMGWVFLKSNVEVLKMCSDILTTDSDFDDQHEFNDYISSKVKESDIYIKSNNEKILKADGMSIRVLRDLDVYRGDYDESSYVCHPLMKKKANKEVQLKKRKLWKL
jgi:hypothetical protein